MSDRFFSAHHHGFVRVGAVAPRVQLANPSENAATIIEHLDDLSDDQVALTVFPELCLTGYSIDDLVLQQSLLDAVTSALDQVRADSANRFGVLVVGAPLAWRNRVYNCAVVIHDGRYLGVVPKTYLPNYREFYEQRWFASGAGITGASIRLPGQHEPVPFGTDLLFAATDQPSMVLGIEICEDMWVPVPPAAGLALAGATLVANLSGSPLTIGKARDRSRHGLSASARYLAGYVFTAAGAGESTTDLAWDGQCFIAENGVMLAESERFAPDSSTCIADVFTAAMVAERRRQGSFDDNARALASGAADGKTTSTTGHRRIEFTLDAPSGDTGLRREVARFPFVPNDPAQLSQDCYEAYNIQVAGLEQRLRAIGASTRPVIGVSGGLDSTHALIVCARAMDRLGRDRSDIIAVTMPGFATSDHTRDNAEQLCAALGIDLQTIDIRPTCTQMLQDLDHPAGRGEPVYDVTFENVQAGVRYDYLFRIANQRGGIVVGTGDLSELALGWCTYGVGDQMSHYNVNAGVPKTLMQHLIRWVVAEDIFDQQAGRVLEAILDTEITPELIPTQPGQKAQSTQDSIGPYALHDFTLYHLLRQGLPPATIAFLAWHAWRDEQRGSWPQGYPSEERTSYSLGTIKHWLGVFLRRFFANQFKRSALPNGPKVLAGGALSPRGDWRMPSDVRATTWLDQLADQVPDEANERTAVRRSTGDRH